MYTVHKNVQIILALLKKYGVRNLVLSAGTRHIPLVFSVEEDDFFHCYSIVDERSAGFFALGLIQTLKEPAAIVCTSGTAACNYVSAVTEAYYQHLPLVVLTSDRNQYFLNQQEDQCIPQMELYKGVCRRKVNLPIVRDEKDFWYCSRLVNEALLELDHRELGPVHINFQIDDQYPIEWGTFKFEEKVLPDVTKIDRVMATDNVNVWDTLASDLTSKKVLILYGQQLPITKEETAVIEKFSEMFNVTFVCDHLANLHIKNKIEDSLLYGQLTNADWDELRPDIVITMHGSMVLNIKEKIRSFGKQGLQHWHVSPDGEVSDPFMCMNKVVECPPIYFFQRLLKNARGKCNNYIDKWKNIEMQRIVNSVSNCEVEYSAVYAVKKLLEDMPDDSLLHISNSNNIRIANMFPIKETVDVYCNRGTCGIDGSMSSFVAQSYVSNRLSFLMIGDLSFFYDMNAIWNRYCTPNMRILLCNNFGGGLFHSSFYKRVQDFKTIDVHIAASHDTSAEGWVKSRGFRYIAAHNKKEFDQAMREFVSKDSDRPIILEVFTDKDIDIRQMGVATNSVKSESSAQLHNLAARIPEPIKRGIKGILKK